MVALLSIPLNAPAGPIMLKSLELNNDAHNPPQNAVDTPINGAAGSPPDTDAMPKEIDNGTLTSEFKTFPTAAASRKLQLLQCNYLHSAPCYVLQVFQIGLHGARNLAPSELMLLGSGHSYRQPRLPVVDEDAVERLVS